MSAPAQQSLVWAGAFVQSFDNVLSPTCVADQISKNISPPKVPAQPPSCPTPLLMCDKEGIEVQKILLFLSGT